MLIRFGDILKKYSIDPKGIIHIGAHLAEEADSYRRSGVKNVIWIEADPDTFSKLSRIVPAYKGNLAYCFAASDTESDHEIFNIASNGESSSLLEMDKHLFHHPHISIIGQKIVRTRRIDNFIREENINSDLFDFVNIDIQGAELLALRGMPNFLEKARYIYSEVNISEIYNGCAKIEEIDEYLSRFGFTRVETHMTQYEWGDAFYIKN